MGSYSVNKKHNKKTGKTYWTVIEETWTDNKRSRPTLSPDEYKAIGFNDDMTAAQATAHAKWLNAQNRLETKKKVAAAKRVNRYKVVESAYIPKDLATMFVDQLLDEHMGSEYHGERLLSRWSAVQKLIKELEIDPREYKDRMRLIYRYFVNEEYSVDYSNKLVTILNQFGYFISKKRNSSFEPVPKPRGQFRAAISEAYLNSDTFIGESEPLTPKLLESKRDQLTVIGNYEWLYVTVWFGLRPSEVDAANFEFRKDEAGVPVLAVYQQKLTGLKDEQRWKLIPIRYDGQRRAVDFIKHGILKRPIRKTMIKVFGKGYTLYAGRKGFEQLMEGLGEEFVNYSAWLGHQSIERTWRNYRNRKAVNYKGKPKRSA